MPCGCNAKSKPSPSLASKAAMCHLCPHGERDGVGVVACTISGKDILQATASDAVCPLGRHPDADGIVVWWGLRWLGVPEPLRWRLVWDLGREPRHLDGCGCIAAIKASWLGPVLEPWLEGVTLLRGRLAALLGDWAEVRSAR